VNNREKFEDLTNKHKADVSAIMSKMIEALTSRMKRHDDSKLTEPEMSGFIKIAPELNGGKKISIDSQEYKDSIKISAVEEHYKNNDHHPEHFENGVEDMNLMQVTEMVADWISASKRYDGVVNLEYQTERFKLDKQLMAIISNTINNLKI